MELLASMLQPEVAALLGRLQATLERPAAGAAPDRDCCVESLNALRLRRQDFFPAVVELLDRGASQAVLGARLPPRPDLGRALPATRDLSLVDENAIDEDGTLQAIATRHEHRASLPLLLLLGQRFAVLLGSPPLLGAALPVGPHALGAAIAGAARRIGLCVHARAMLYRLYDMDFMTRYPGFIEALDASIDREGVLPGLAFVPLRPAGAQAYAGRGQGAAPELPPAQANAAKVVAEAVASLRQSGRMPDSVAAERNFIVAAMARYLLKYGEDSEQWRQAMHYARSVIEAVERGEPPSAAARAWIVEALQSLGHADEEAQRVANALTSVRAVPDAVVRKADGIRSAREQRCAERLAMLSIGTRLGFSTGQGGFTRWRLRYHYVEPGLLLLANQADGEEALVEVDAVARQMAAGHAWIIRSGPATGDPNPSEPPEGPAQAWPAHASGRGLS